MYGWVYDMNLVSTISEQCVFAGSGSSMYERRTTRAVWTRESSRRSHRGCERYSQDEWHHQRWRSALWNRYQDETPNQTKLSQSWTSWASADCWPSMSWHPPRKPRIDDWRRPCHLEGCVSISGGHQHNRGFEIVVARPDGKRPLCKARKRAVLRPNPVARRTRDDRSPTLHHCTWPVEFWKSSMIESRTRPCQRFRTNRTTDAGGCRDQHSRMPHWDRAFQAGWPNRDQLPGGCRMRPWGGPFRLSFRGFGWDCVQSPVRRLVLGSNSFNCRWWRSWPLTIRSSNFDKNGRFEIGR